MAGGVGAGTGRCSYADPAGADPAGPRRASGRSFTGPVARRSGPAVPRATGRVSAREVLGEPDVALAVAYHVDADVRERGAEQIAPVPVPRRLLVEHALVEALGGAGDRGRSAGHTAPDAAVLAGRAPVHALGVDPVSERPLAAALVRQPAAGGHRQVVLVGARDEAGHHYVGPQA